jgi:diguanylate cyclase (GGDEF)-like protein
MDQIRERLVASPLFRSVSPALVDSVLSVSEPHELPLHHRLLEVSAENDKLYVILSGAVSIYVPGSDVPLMQLGVGECVGELSLIDGGSASAAVVTEGPTTVLAIPRSQIWVLVDASAEFARNLLRVLAGRVRHDDEVLADAHRRRVHFEHLATVDGLTGLRNRTWLDDAFPRQLQRSERGGQPCVLLMIDIDRFKVVNDQHGHLVGDAVLTRVASILTSELRPQDLLARYGGEEFAVLLPGMPGGDARVVAERLRTAIAAAHLGDPADEPRPPVTISIGLAVSEPDERLDTLMARADAALYRAKDQGRNRVSH